MLKTLKNRSGFTIIELLIVIVVIGILALLVLNTFNGVQARARDAQRTTDLNAVRTQLEVYFTDNGGYPAASVFSTDALATDAFQGIDAGALVAPDGTSRWTDAPASATNEYGYQPTGCNTATPVACDSYTLGVFLEDTETAETRSSLN